MRLPSQTARHGPHHYHSAFALLSPQTDPATGTAESISSSPAACRHQKYRTRGVILSSLCELRPKTTLNSLFPETITLLNPAKSAEQITTHLNSRNVPKRNTHLMSNQPADFPKINTSRIDAIRNRLDDDNYTVDIQHLTSKLIDLEIALTEADKKQVA